ncbi:iap-3 [Cryptophlebia peltastica nucleopolyhedrovirus]|uniref:Iap-3 n=1 Tax=Cryptophlebia peltastica nucleopolyhedrovirus TaxID=2304025 RepID=A0A346RNW9_9ABAC|nr:iap-3 [Cryptophlebia peltastica nucleopolyhedrovirus]AXS67766.1 iap-3 [Cryptophlebia peltastica nucleopolyhedrovirus]
MQRLQYGIFNWTEIESDYLIEHIKYSPKCKYVLSKLDEETRPDFVPTETPKYDFVCVVCMVGKKSILFEPCRHLVCCENCASKVDQCVMCRSLILERKKIFLN